LLTRFIQAMVADDDQSGADEALRLLAALGQPTIDEQLVQATFHGLSIGRNSIVLVLVLDDFAFFFGRTEGFMNGSPSSSLKNQSFEDENEDEDD